MNLLFFLPIKKNVTLTYLFCGFFSTSFNKCADQIISPSVSNNSNLSLEEEFLWLYLSSTCVNRKILTKEEN